MKQVIRTLMFLGFLLRITAAKLWDLLSDHVIFYCWFILDVYRFRKVAQASVGLEATGVLSAQIMPGPTPNTNPTTIPTPTPHSFKHKRSTVVLSKPGPSPDNKSCKLPTILEADEEDYEACDIDW